jgi:hypothetical protein
MHHEERVSKAVSDLISLPGLQGFWGNLNADEQKHFQQHLRMYVKIYMPDCPFEISSTNRYTSKLHEATVTAREPIKTGAAIKYLCGTRVRLTSEKDANLKEHFSIIQERGKATSIFLGPARFVNHECKPNAILQRLGYTGMEVRATQDIQAGEEITVSYGDHYFDNDDGTCECRCKICEETQRNGVVIEESSTKAVLEPSAELSIGYPVHHNTRQKLKRPCQTSLENPGINSLQRVGKRARCAIQLLPENHVLTRPRCDQSVCGICYGQVPRDATLECPNCRRNIKIYGQQWPRRRENPYIEPESQVAAKEDKSSSLLMQQFNTEIVISDYNQAEIKDIVDDDYFPTLEELLRFTLRRQGSIEEPKKSQHAIPKAEQRPFQGNSSSINIAQSIFINFGDSNGK